MEPWLESFAQTNFQRSSDTAHDLKTPLNVAVLNLELLRMRVRKLADGDEDQKLVAYARSIEMELRRMARIFDAYFCMASPPKNEGDPVLIDISIVASEAAGEAGYELQPAKPFFVEMHESRIRTLFKMLFDGASTLFTAGEKIISASGDATHFELTLVGNAAQSDLEPTKVFKFYYTDPLGNPDLSLATARLIAETYGGQLIAEQENDKVSLRLSMPLGEK